VAVEKLPPEKFAEIRIASGCPTNDFLCSFRHFLIPKLSLISEILSFSTPTGDFTT
jgi:hypothetical protein